MLYFRSVFTLLLLKSVKYPSIPKETKGRALCMCFGQDLKKKLALETSMVVVASRMLMRELQGHRNVVNIILSLVDLCRNSGKN